MKCPNCGSDHLGVSRMMYQGHPKPGDYISSSVCLDCRYEFDVKYQPTPEIEVLLRIESKLDALLEKIK